LVVAGLNVATVVLIEVFKLIVDVNRSFNLLSDLNWQSAHFVNARFAFAIVDHDLLDLVTHDVENDTQAQKDDTEYAKSDHG